MAQLIRACERDVGGCTKWYGSSGLLQNSLSEVKVDLNLASGAESVTRAAAV